MPELFEMLRMLRDEEITRTNLGIDGEGYYRRKTEIQTIDNILAAFSVGNLLYNLELIDINTWLTSLEVCKRIFHHHGLFVFNDDVITANMGIYRLVGDEVVFDLLERKGNLYLDQRFRKDAYLGMQMAYSDKRQEGAGAISCGHKTDFFILPKAMKQHVMAAINGGASSTVHYSGLRLKSEGYSIYSEMAGTWINVANDCDRICYYVGDDGNATQEEKKLFQGVFGTKNPHKYTQISYPKDYPRIYLYSEKKIREKLKGNEDEIIATNFCIDGETFYATGLRGWLMPKVIGRPKVNLRLVYATLLDHIDSLSGAEVVRLYEALQQRIDKTK